MFQVRYFSVEPSGTYTVNHGTYDNETQARGEALLVNVSTGFRSLVLQKMRGGWHVIYDSDLGY